MDSIITTLESRATTESATASTSDHVKGVARVTGQYIYDLFMNDKGEQTKMDFVRFAVEHVEVDAFKKALKDFVEIASKRGDAYKKTAQNHQSVMRTAYGAVRFAGEALSRLGGDATTGYQAMRVLGKQALKEAGLKWDGTLAPTEADAAVQAADKAQATALAGVRADTPMLPNESPFEYEQRCRGILAQRIAENTEYLAEIAKRQDVADLAAKVKKLCVDEDTLKAVMQAILNDGTFDLTIGE